MLSETKGHSAAQPGLRGHSWSADSDLMKRYVVEVKTPGAGWLAMSSFHTESEAFHGQLRQPAGVTRIHDQFAR